jgi:hypothetical protein
MSAERRTNRSGKPKKQKATPHRKGSFFQHKTADEIAAEQGKGPVTNLDEIIGKGKGLWKSDAEFEQFVADIYKRRRQGR